MSAPPRRAAVIVANQQRDREIGFARPFAEYLANVATHSAAIGSKIDRIDCNAETHPLAALGSIRSATSVIALNKPCAIIDAKAFFEK